MRRPDNVDIWDEVELSRDETLSEKEKDELILQTLEKARTSAEIFNAKQQAAREKQK